MNESDSSKTLTSGEGTTSGSDSDSGSSTSSDSDSESDSDSSSTSTILPKKKSVAPSAKKAKKASDNSSSSSDAEPGSTAEPKDERIKEISKGNAPVKNITAPPSSSSSSSSESDSESDSSSDSDSDVDSEPQSHPKRKAKAKSVKVTTKKRKISDDGTAVVTATTSALPKQTSSNRKTHDESTHPSNSNYNGRKKAPQQVVRFQRIKADTVTADSIIDSRYEAKVGLLY
jgi:clumping factor B